MCRSGIKHVAKRYILFLVTARVYCYYLFTLCNIGTCDESDILIYVSNVCLSSDNIIIDHTCRPATQRLKEPSNDSLVSALVKRSLLT